MITNFGHQSLLPNIKQQQQQLLTTSDRILLIMFFLFVLFTLQVSKIAAYAYSAISQIKVDAKEELVVQFAIP